MIYLTDNNITLHYLRVVDNFRFDFWAWFSIYFSLRFAWSWTRNWIVKKENVLFHTILLLLSKTNKQKQCVKHFKVTVYILIT